MTPRDYPYLPTRDELHQAIVDAAHTPTRDLWKIVRANLSSLDAVAALRTLEGRLNTPEILNYHQYLRSDRWKAKRAAKLETNPACEKCGATDNLQVHHLTYEHVGFELPEDLQTLCATCHAGAHGK